MSTAEKCKKIAWPAAWQASRALRRHPRGSELRVYHCGVCGGWHLGHPREMRWKKFEGLLEAAR